MGLTLQWVVSSSSCTNFWLLLPLSPLSPVRPRPRLVTWAMPQLCTTPTPTGPERAPPTAPQPATAAGLTTERERLRLSLDTCTLPTTTEPTLTPTATDTVLLEWLDTQELPPPSLPGHPRDLVRGVLMLSPATWPTDTDTLPCQSPTMVMDLQPMESACSTLEPPAPSRLSPGSKSKEIFIFHKSKVCTL